MGLIQKIVSKLMAGKIRFHLLGVMTDCSMGSEFNHSSAFKLMHNELEYYDLKGNKGSTLFLTDGILNLIRYDDVRVMFPRVDPNSILKLDRVTTIDDDTFVNLISLKGLLTVYSNIVTEEDLDHQFKYSLLTRISAFTRKNHAQARECIKRKIKFLPQIGAYRKWKK